MPSDNDDTRRRVESVGGRPFQVGMPGVVLDGVQSGTQKLTYRGLRFPKNPFDIALYMRLIQRLEPRTVIEIGTSQGGGALWFADMCKNFGLDTRIFTIDLQLPHTQHPGIEYYKGDACQPELTFPTELLRAQPHPWLISEDSAHTYEACAAVLDYFVPGMWRGDYIVIEDGIVADLTAQCYRCYEDGPNRAVSEFIKNNVGVLEIDTDLCDLFGHNVTFAPNAWLKRR
jgi:cephalosporin hydroxylase